MEGYPGSAAAHTIPPSTGGRLQLSLGKAVPSLVVPSDDLHLPTQQQLGKPLN